MKFGKEFGIHLEQTLPEWKDKYLCYKPLKKLLKNLPTSSDDNQNLPPDLQQWFVRILNEELDKFNDFYVDKEEEFVIRFQVFQFEYTYKLLLLILNQNLILTFDLFFQVSILLL